MYRAYGSNVYFVHRDNTQDARVNCDSNVTAVRVAERLNRADFLNNVKRKYTESARLHAEIESMSGVRFIEV
jgi:hypothetical protein